MALPFFNAYRGSIGRFFQGDPTLNGYWQLDGNSLDNSGNGNNGTDTAVSYSPAYSKFNGGQGAYFNGSSSYIQVPSFVSGISNATLMLWVSVKSFPQTINEIGGLGSDGKNSSFFFYAYNNPKFAGFIRTSSGSLVQVGEYYNFSFNNWYHLAMTYNGAIASFYVNGNLINSATTSGTIGGVPFLLGQTTVSSYNYWFNGSIDEVGFWTRTLSPSEISQYYQWATSFKKKSWYSLLPVILLSLSESVTNTDTFLKGIYRSFTEAVTNTDTFAGIKVLLALFTEAVQSTDTLIKTISKNLSETIQNTDTLIKTTIKNFRESITNSDTLNTLKFVVLNLFESVKSTTSLWINGMFIDTWWTKRTKAAINWIKRNKPQ
jgi:hypothetical protein